MPAAPTRVAERIKAGLAHFQPILASARQRDVGEADTVTIIKDMLSEIFGYDKYTEVTSEYAIRGTYCDLAIKVDNQLKLLVEVKAIGLGLKDQHVKQAIDYAANQGIDWVVLTNGVVWRVYRLVFAKPIGQEMVLEVNLLDLKTSEVSTADTLYLWCREGWQKSALGEYTSRKQALSKFFVGAALQMPPVLDVLRREMRRVSPNVKFDTEDLLEVLLADVIKRDVLEGQEAEEARNIVNSAADTLLRVRGKRSTPGSSAASEHDRGASASHEGSHGVDLGTAPSDLDGERGNLNA